MDSALPKERKKVKKGKSRKKNLNKLKLLEMQQTDDTEPLCDPKRKKKFAEEGKSLIFQKKKKPQKTSVFVSSSSHTANKFISNNDIEDAGNAVKNLYSLSSKTEQKKKSTNKHKVCMEEKGGNLKISKNINRKRKCDTEIFSIREDENVTCKRSKSTSSDILNEFRSRSNKSSKNKCKRNSIASGSAQNEGLNESDSDEDREIRNELKSSSIYSKIQELMRDNPSMLSTVNVGEKESPQNLSESDLEEESMECSDDINSDGADKVPKVLQKDVFMQTSSNKRVAEKKDSDATLSDVKISKIKEIPITCANNDFNKTKKSSIASRGEKVISKRGPSSFRDKALEKLQSAKFRYLNEKLYTESGKDSFNYFQVNTDDYMDYHKGYSLQVAKWPLNPVDKIIGSLQKMKKKLIIADMGCGDAKIARTLTNCTVHSFDLVALNEFVTPCNISKVPLSNESVDIVVFCLSLMGTNLKEYLQEAYRIAKFGSVLKIVEVESRIPSLDQFIKSIEALGFSIVKKDVEHKLFVFLEFKKIKKNKKSVSVQAITLKPCLYKKR